MKMSSEELRILEGLKEALSKFVPKVAEEPVAKLIFDPNTGKVEECTFEETDRHHMVLTKEEYEFAVAHRSRLHVINGKLVQMPRQETENVFLEEGGETYKTTEENMLIMGNDKGWDERKGN